MRKELCPYCGNDIWGYFTEDWSMCMKCGRIFIRTCEKYDFGIKQKKLVLEFIPEKSCKN